MSKREPVLTKKDLNQCGRRFHLTNTSIFNYEIQCGASAVYSEARALRKIYPDDDDYQKSLLNQFQYYNTHPFFSNLILSAGLAMEDQNGLDALDAVQSLKVGLMGPLAGVGDSFFWILLPTIFGSLAGYMGQEGNPAGLVIWSVLFFALFLWRSTWWNYGYKMGTSLITELGSKLSAFTEAASILGLFVVGAMIPSVVSIQTGLQFHYGEVTLAVQTDILDAIFPCMLPALLTWLVYVLLKKGVKVVYIILGLIVLGCIGAATGLLA